MTDPTQQWYNNFKKELEGLSDLEFIAAFNREAGKFFTVSARMAYFAAIRQEFKNRNIDISAISKDGGVSYKYRIALYELNGNKFILPLKDL